MSSLTDLVHAYDSGAPLERASTIPAPWYVDEHMFGLERRTVFARSWQVVARADQVAAAGQFVSGETADGEPFVVVRGEDGVLRAFFNVCRHHAAAVVTSPEGSAHLLRCPYHGWTYALSGELKGTPDFAGVCDFDRAANGLVPLPVGVWESWVFVGVDAGASLDSFLGTDLVARIAPLRLSTAAVGRAPAVRARLQLEGVRRQLPGRRLPRAAPAQGPRHRPRLRSYTIENGARFCLQSSPLVSDGAEAATGAVRTGDRAWYFWIYPNFMINCYGGTMDTNLVVPLGVDRTEVLFDFYFADVSEAGPPHNRASIEVADRIQEEDLAICASVQRGLRSRAYTAGRLSVRREAGEHLFHRLLHADLLQGL